MKRLASWLERQQRRHARLPRLEDALLGRRPLAYIAHRLRFVTLRVVLRTALHIVEVVALAQVFPPRSLGPILLLRHATLLLSSLYWGALEAQRIALRGAHQRHDDAEFAGITSRWSAAALIVILGAQLVAAGFLCLAPRSYPGFSIYDAYAIACGIRFGLDVWSRTKHSTVFAVARVRRPLVSMVAIDLLEVFGLLIAWLRMGPFAFALMLVVSGALRAGMTLWFARSTADQRRLPGAARSLWREFSRGGLRRLPLRQAAKFALLNASLQIDSLAIVILSLGLAGDEGVVLSLSLHAFAPLLGAGFAWTRVFYFDFVRLGANVCPLLGARFGRLLDRVAILYPLVLVALVVPIATWLVPEYLAIAPVALVGFVVARSIFALRQMEAYSYADHRAQLRQGAVFVVGVVATLLIAHRLDTMLVGVTSGLILAALIGGRAGAKRPPHEPGASLCFEEFVEWLSSQDRPVRLVLLGIDRRMTSVARVRLALTKRGFDGPTLQPSHHQLLMALSSPLDPRELSRWIVAATAGTATSIRIGEVASRGDDARAQLREHGPFAELYGSSGSKATLPEIGFLAREFAHQFPDGVLLTGSSGSIRKLGVAERGQLHAILSSMNARRPQRNRRSRCIEVAAYRPKGEVSHLFVLPRSSPRQPEFSGFRQQVESASRHACLRQPLDAALHDQ